MQIQFFGAARTVTGSKHLLTTDSGQQILFDCGMFQGTESKRGRENYQFGFEPSAVDMVFLSHAHIDHSGLLPRLVREGFTGPIYCTAPTFDLCQIMLPDSARIQQYDSEYLKKKNLFKEEETELYTLEDVLQCLDQFEVLPYDEWQVINEEVTVMLTYVGHILGSACVNLRIKEGDATRAVAYTGDIGRPEQQIIKRPKPFPKADIIITESTYGDSLHEPLASTKDRLLQIVKETCVDKKGKLIIPAFSLGRTQELVYALDQLETEGKLPAIKVFVDSPLSTNATEIIKRHPESYNKDILKYMESDSHPFSFSNLHYIRDVKYSKQLNEFNEPCIIISASGMAEAGRILHHLKNNIEHERNTILIVGYCEPSTRGGQLREGQKTLHIFGKEYKVRARVEIMDAYSAHGDYNEMIDYLSCQDAAKVQKVFLVHGRYEVQEQYSAHLNAAGFKDVYIPEDDEAVVV